MTIETKEIVVLRRPKPASHPVEMWVYQADKQTALAKRLVMGWWIKPVDEARRASLYYDNKSGKPIDGWAMFAAKARGIGNEIPIEDFSKSWSITMLRWVAQVEATSDDDPTDQTPPLLHVDKAVGLYRIDGPGETFFQIDGCRDYRFGDFVKGLDESSQYGIEAAARKAFVARAKAYDLDDTKATTDPGYVIVSEETAFTSTNVRTMRRHQAAALKQKMTREEEKRAALARQEAEERARRLALGGATAAMTNEQFAAYMREQRAKKGASR